MNWITNVARNDQIGATLAKASGSRSNGILGTALVQEKVIFVLPQRFIREQRIHNLAGCACQQTC